MFKRRKPLHQISDRHRRRIVNMYVNNVPGCNINPTVAPLAVDELALIGGKDVHNITFRLMPQIMTDEVSVQYSYLGGKGKRVFSQLKILTVVQAAVRRSKGTATDDEIAAPIKKWLVKGKERIQRKNKGEVSEPAISNPFHS
ncbi:hypothetical protein M8J77_005917 [Diaphorina citri]|nr:hypothetical protein M8J77_005917 [Diaphorina citri]